MFSQLKTVEAAIICAFFLAMIIIIMSYRKINANRQLVASVITVLGILGTFVGISYGLYMFDENNIQESIPNLLGGLKVAFITSILGIFFSIILKLKTANYQKKLELGNQPNVEGSTIDDLNSNLLIIAQAIKEDKDNSSKRLKAIEDALTGDGETTVVTQLQKTRIAFIDKQEEILRATKTNHQELLVSFNNFAEKMAENNSKALIEALKEVIRDFNTKINEQFGDNFKQLNNAVGKLLEWQEQYRKHLEKITEEFEIAVNSIETSKNSLVKISEKCEYMDNAMIHLETLLDKFIQQQKEFEKNIGSFATLREKANEAFPLIEKRIDDLTIGFKKNVDASIANITTITKNLDSFIRLNIDKMENMAKETLISYKENSTIIKNQSNELSKIMLDIKTKNEGIMSETNRNIDRLYQETSKRIEKQLKDLDKQLEEELNKSIGSLGSQLLSLSKKFVDDYTPLTDKLKSLINVSKGLNNE